MPKFTKRFVEAITPDPEKTLKFWDVELKGFGLIVLPSGRRTYCIEYRNADRIKKRLKIGIHGTITTEEARDLAKKRLSQVAHGEDPAEQKKQINFLPTMEDLALHYIERHGYKKRPNSLKGDQGLIKNVILPALGDIRGQFDLLHQCVEKVP